MFDRFEDPSRKLMGLAREVALEWHHDHIDTEHILLAFFRQPGSKALQILEKIGADPNTIRDSVTTHMTAAPEEVNISGVPFTFEAKRVLEHTLDECGRFGSGTIGTEHLLAGLVRAKEGLASQALRDCGVTIDAIRDARF